MNRNQKLFGWLGSILLLLIIPIKVVRVTNLSEFVEFIIGIAPSILGPAGLLFLLQSGTGKFSKLSLNQITALVAVISFALEFAQLLPRSGILANVKYTFDWYDVCATVLSVCIGYCIAYTINKKTSRIMKINSH